MRGILILLILVIIGAVAASLIGLKEKLKDAVAISFNNITYNYANSEHNVGVVLKMKNNILMPIKVSNIVAKIYDSNDKQIARVNKSRIELEPGKSKLVTFYIKDLDIEKPSFYAMAMFDKEKLKGHYVLLSGTVYNLKNIKERIEL